MQFRGRYYFLSNFYPCSIEIDGLRYESAEAAFQGQKNSQYAHMFTGSVTPLETKRLGRRVPIDVREWNARRLEVMKRVVWAKFAQNPKLRKLLIAVTEPIVEDNTWGDTYFTSLPPLIFLLSLFSLFLTTSNKQEKPMCTMCEHSSESNNIDNLLEAYERQQREIYINRTIPAISRLEGIAYDLANAYGHGKLKATNAQKGLFIAIGIIGAMISIPLLMHIPLGLSTHI